MTKTKRRMIHFILTECPLTIAQFGEKIKEAEKWMLEHDAEEIEEAGKEGNVVLVLKTLALLVTASVYHGSIKVWWESGMKMKVTSDMLVDVAMGILDCEVWEPSASFPWRRKEMKEILQRLAEEEEKDD